MSNLSSAPPTFNKNYSRLRAHSHNSFLSTIDENGYDNDDNTSSEEATNTNKVNNNKNNVVNFLNIITIYVIMMIIIGGTAIIATEKGTESMMEDILLDAKYNHKQEGNITMRRRKQLLLDTSIIITIITTRDAVQIALLTEFQDVFAWRTNEKPMIP